MDEILEEKEVMERQASLHNESDNLNTQNMLQTMSVKSESLKSGKNNQNSEKSLQNSITLEKISSQKEPKAKLHSKKSSIMEIEDVQSVKKKSSKNIVKPLSQTAISVKHS